MFHPIVLVREINTSKLNTVCMMIKKKHQAVYSSMSLRASICPCKGTTIHIHEQPDYLLPCEKCDLLLPGD